MNTGQPPLNRRGLLVLAMLSLTLAPGAHGWQLAWPDALIWSFRWPRTLTAVAAGAGLALPEPGDPVGLGGPPAFNAEALEAGEAVETGALTVQDPDEFASYRDQEFRARGNCPSAMSDDELIQALQEAGWEEPE